MPRGNQAAGSYGFRDITRDEANGVALNDVTQREALTRLA
jgi:hypothetical protein